ncbi:hypothetical protein [Halobacillus seohaensis]|uniref:Uncharacterized protein n=1 Tax=Halobacillus seohaensis TaxID=447421 RepID=A0ABW2EQU9_9BACI
MKPPMNQSIEVKNPLLDDKGTPVIDRYGKPQLAAENTRARVQYSTKVVRGTDGQQYESSLEVDLSPSIKVSYGSEISYTDPLGTVTKGKVMSMNESMNFAGNKVYFRTVNVG